MKYIISESSLHPLIDRLFIKRYGGLLQKEKDKDDYIRFYDIDGGKPFDLTEWGVLWANDYIFLEKLKNIFGLETSEEIVGFFKNYFKDRYDVNVNYVSSEGGYHRDGDNLEDADPWWDRG